MKILSIETSCDETAVSIVEAHGDFPTATYTVLGNALFSQIDIHREYGGVFPALAKREHAKTLIPMTSQALHEARLYKESLHTLPLAHRSELETILLREPGLLDSFVTFIECMEKPPIDLIAVTQGPGLEPALWVGINFARALSYIWNIPLVPINHMEGHTLSSLFDGEKLPTIPFPALALLISGGHTELDLMNTWGSYACIGETRDDAVGEAFDKVARMLGLPYPGGPEVSARAEHARTRNLPRFATLPRPMIDTDNLDFSFSGLKTAVRYAIENMTLSEDDIASVAREFEDAVTDVLLKKTERAINEHGVMTLIVGGGVSANNFIRESFITHFKTKTPDLAIYFPPKKLSTDNSIMIALAGHARSNAALPYTSLTNLHANGNLSLSTN